MTGEILKGTNFVHGQFYGGGKIYVYGVLFFVVGALIHWASSKTSRIVSSSTEAEIHGLVHGKENIWEREFHKELFYFKSLR